jgi:pilus assembly protein Flp/PilA
MLAAIEQFMRDDSGATAIEYGLIASLISVASISVFQKVGTKMKSTFNDIANNLAS